MNAQNQIVMRINGYRSPKEFKQVLNYVRDKVYLKSTFSNYRNQHYVSGQYYKKFDNWSMFMNYKLKDLIDSGHTVDVWK